MNFKKFLEKESFPKVNIVPDEKNFDIGNIVPTDVSDRVIPVKALGEFAWGNYIIARKKFFNSKGEYSEYRKFSWFAVMGEWLEIARYCLGETEIDKRFEGL